MSQRTPKKILDVLDQAQLKLNSKQFDLRSLLWEVIMDMLDSLGRYDNWGFENMTPTDIVNKCHDMLEDYVSNAYGD